MHGPIAASMVPYTPHTAPNSYSDDKQRVSPGCFFCSPTLARLTFAAVHGLP